MTSQRTSNHHLPETAELDRILTAEVGRPLPPGHIATHYADFTAIKALLTHLNLPASLFTDDTLDIHAVVAGGRHLLDQLVANLLAAEPTPATRRLLDAVYDYLAEADAPTATDLIFVFGAKTSLRADRAAELFHAGVAPRILVSGARPIYADPATPSEAERYRHLLLARGVPSEAIIVEPDAITVPDNVRRSLNLLDQLNLPYRSLTLVNSPYSQRRGWAIFRKHLPDTITLHRINSATSPLYARTHWTEQAPTLRVILNEYIKLRASVAYNTA